MKIVDTYKKEIVKTQSLLDQANALVSLWSIIRFISFIGFVIAFILLIQQNIWLGIGSFYVLAFVFIKIVKRHVIKTAKRDQLNQLVKNKKLEIQYIQNHYTDREEGQEYRNPLHSYSSDLDIFGNQSMFQLVERCNTKIGKDRLADRFLNKLSKPQIKENQEAIQEIEYRSEWSQCFFAHSINEDDSTFNPTLIQQWLDVDDGWIDTKVFHIVSYLFPICASILAWYLGGLYGWVAGVLAFVPNAYLLRKYQHKIEETQNKVGQTLKYVTKYAPLFSEIERTSFESTKLKILRAKLILNDKSTEQQLRKLDWYLDQLEMKTNMFGTIFNIITLWDLHFMRLLFSWKKRNADHIFYWLDALAEFEFLNSLAILARNQPSWSRPIIEEDGIIDATALGHPLIHPTKMIPNSISFPTNKHIKLITGSNMGGKSTFLRTIGLNLVLTYMGSKVCAAKLTTPILDVITSMRTNDALQENTSGFHAELKRLKLILDSVKAQKGNYFLIDEVLKGTNTKDRHEGSKALIRQLIDHDGAGLVSTHDLELAKLEKELEGKLENKCFEVEVSGDKLTFDYKIKYGVSQSFNATQLMRNMGIEI